MSEQMPVDPGQSPSNQPYDWREERRQERAQRREERRAMRGNQAWVWGIVLVLIGLILLLRNFGLPFLQNWWALFILVPAVGAFTTAWNLYRDAGNRLSAPARGSLIGGIVLTMVAFIFLFGMNWGLLWPILLILVGIAVLANAFLPG